MASVGYTIGLMESVIIYHPGGGGGGGWQGWRILVVSQ